jgi:hypothetical protein
LFIGLKAFLAAYVILASLSFNQCFSSSSAGLSFETNSHQNLADPLATSTKKSDIWQVFWAKFEQSSSDGPTGLTNQTVALVRAAILEEICLTTCQYCPELKKQPPPNRNLKLNLTISPANPAFWVSKGEGKLKTQSGQKRLNLRTAARPLSPTPAGLSPATVKSPKNFQPLDYGLINWLLSLKQDSRSSRRFSGQREFFEPPRAVVSQASGPA